MRSIVLIVLLYAANCRAQPYQIVFNHFGVQEGFTASEALQMVEGKHGLVWIATESGLAKFDSKRFTFYKHNDNDSNSIAHNYCNGVAENAAGKIFVICNNDLDILDPKTNKFKHMQVVREGKLGSVHPVRLLYDHSRKLMWVCTKAGR
jgi:ligand-binding sensor domain-containing protein